MNGVALDHIGFGLSSRSARREDHRPQSHAQRLAALLDHLDLRDITLFMNDWGGPIGLDFARRHPERVKRLVIATPGAGRSATPSVPSFIRRPRHDSTLVRDAAKPVPAGRTLAKWSSR